jgi:hypothetical protein
MGIEVYYSIDLHQEPDADIPKFLVAPVHRHVLPKIATDPPALEDLEEFVAFGAQYSKPQN